MAFDTVTLDHQKRATVYLRGMFGYKRYLVRSVKIARGSYAQYTNAAEVRFVPKGARSERGTVESYAPSCVVIDGWSDFDPGSPWTAPTRSGSGVTVQAMRHSSCSDAWSSEFDAALAAHLEKTGETVLADLRRNDPHAKPEAK